MGRKVCLRCKGKTLLGVVNKLLKTKSLLTTPSNVLPLHIKPTFLLFANHYLNFHWRWSKVMGLNSGYLLRFTFLRFLRVLYGKFCLYTSSKLSCPYFEFSLKMKVMGLNSGYLLKSFLIYGFSVLGQPGHCWKKWGQIIRKILVSHTNFLAFWDTV